MIRFFLWCVLVGVALAWAPWVVVTLGIAWALTHRKQMFR